MPNEGIAPEKGRYLLAVVLLGWAGTGLALPVDDDRRAERAAMVREVEAHARSLSTGSRDAISREVLTVLGRLPRHHFVPEEQRRHAYENRPLPIGYGQTISQPFIVALMTDMLAVRPGDKVLEIGTGSGYQAAVLAELGIRTFTIEIIPPLAEQAATRLAALGYAEIRTRTGDGYYGWPEEAPFDGIIVTAAASHIPPPLVQQLKPGGRMVIPVGASFHTQVLMLVKKDVDGSVRTYHKLPVRFVPLTGGH